MLLNHTGPPLGLCSAGKIWGDQHPTLIPLPDFRSRRSGEQRKTGASLPGLDQQKENRTVIKEAVY